MAAAGLGWDVKVLDSLGCEELKSLMGLHVFPEFEIPSRAVRGKIPEIEFSFAVMGSLAIVWYCIVVMLHGRRA